ncbi:FitA-like ribbon-helix-helix domain-containing protein [Salaquimonas pukyongi]|uniref:FitA-like ribbon-helix-helix domain-containing protein n=1 Tax=Salaquimonas pukyongi TaxID=2712698 RepID=UPI00096BAA41|nr:Arc family DNA-binding protein [Salaquimonas pukyongi]
MATLTIRNLPDEVRQALRERAARNGVSMEQEVRRILAESMQKTAVKHMQFKAAEDILQMARGLRDEAPLDPMYKELSHKELTDTLWNEGHDR